MRNKDAAYKAVQERILALIDKGDTTWLKPWKPGFSGRAWSLTTGEPYRGINDVLLSCAPVQERLFITRHKATQAGGRVKPGAEPYLITFWHTPIKVDEATGERRKLFFLRITQAFALEDTEGIPSELVEPVRLKAGLKTVVGPDPIEGCDRVVRNWSGRPTISHGGNRAFYAPARDHVQMPELAQFRDAESYYSTLFHELTHSTGHAKRLGRKEVTSINRFGSHDYGVEELVAEWGASYLAALCGIDRVVEDNSARYLASWREKISADVKLVVWAASRAQKAVELITAGLETRQAGEPVQEPEQGENKPNDEPADVPDISNVEDMPGALRCYRCEKEHAPVWKCQRCAHEQCYHVKTCTVCGRKGEQ